MKHQPVWMRVALGAVLFVYVLLGGVMPAHADNAAQSLPFAQDWSNTSLITTDDDWSGVPGIIGYLGDDPSSTATGIDPQTILVERMTNPDVIANQTSTSISNGGVAEFHLDDPVIALQGSNTADSPFILINLKIPAATLLSRFHIIFAILTGLPITPFNRLPCTTVWATAATSPTYPKPTSPMLPMDPIQAGK